MTKELQDHAWSILPKEFKEEVKKYYRTLHEQYKEYDGLHFETAIAKVQEMIVTLEYFFGGHNLTSEAEGEEMLIVSRKEIQQLVEANDIVILKAAGIDNIETIQAKTVNTILNRLFGSKCLPDELNEDNFAKSEPKNEGTHQEHNLTAEEEPEVEHFADAGKMFDSFIRQTSREHDRLHIAAILAQSFVSEMYLAPRDIPRIVTASLGVADALIAAVKEGGRHD